MSADPEDGQLARVEPLPQPSPWDDVGPELLPAEDEGHGILPGAALQAMTQDLHPREAREVRLGIIHQMRMTGQVASMIEPGPPPMAGRIPNQFPSVLVLGPDGRFYLSERPPLEDVHV